MNFVYNFISVDLQTLLNTMVYVPAEKPQRKRRATEAATTGMEQEDFEDVPVGTPRARKKRRTTQSTRQSLLDLSDPVCFLNIFSSILTSINYCKFLTLLALLRRPTSSSSS